MICRQWKYILVTMFLLLLLTSCSYRKKDVTHRSKSMASQKNNKLVVKDEEVINPFTGLPIDKKQKNPRPIAIMVENEYNSRPQSGLKKACIVYEALTEGGITRFLAIFLDNDVTEIGPVRSSRPYFIDYASEYDSIYVHYGASPKAYGDLKRLLIDNIDGIYDSKTFWRDKTRKSPHNAYTNMQNILDTVKSYKVLKHVKSKFLDFHDPEYELIGTKAEKIRLSYNNNYDVYYYYNKEGKIYERLINNKLHTDRKTNSPIFVKNIIVQFHDTKVIDDEGRLDIKTVGTGQGYYISEGVLQKIAWQKDSRKSKTDYFYVDGKKLKIKPGNTWIQVMPKKSTVTIIE